MRVLRIAHSGIMPPYRERDRQLVRQFGATVLLIVPARWPHLGSETVQLTEPFDLATVPTWLTGNIPLFAYDWQTVAELIKRFNPDIIDIHEEPYSVSAFQLVSLAMLYAPKAVRVFYSAQNISKFYPPPFCLSEQFVYTNCQGAYPVSTEVQAVLRRKGFAGAAPIVPLGIDPEVFQPPSSDQMADHTKDRPFTIGFFGRLEKCKGLEVLAHAAAALSPDVDFHLRIAGSGSYKSALTTLCEELSLESRTTLEKEKPYSEMPQCYSSCDVVVIPSLTTRSWKEQFGRVAIESMACGVPVIASNSGSLVEVIGDAGIIVSENNPEALASALIRLARDPSLRSILRHRSLIRSQQFTWQVVASKMMELYHQALGASGMRSV